MHVVTMKKRDSMTLVIHAPKGRGHAVPKGQTHKDKRRLPKVAERAKFRKELT
jgi:hypothetical protein